MKHRSVFTHVPTSLSMYYAQIYAALLTQFSKAYSKHSVLGLACKINSSQPASVFVLCMLSVLSSNLIHERTPTLFWSYVTAQSALPISNKYSTRHAVVAILYMGVQYQGLNTLY